MRPRALAPEAEVVGVGLAHGAAGRGLQQLIGDAVGDRVGDGLVFAVEAQADLRLHVARAGPAHQGIDLARRLRLVLEHPFLGARGPRLHGGLGGSIDAGNHGSGAPPDDDGGDEEPRAGANVKRARENAKAPAAACCRGRLRDSGGSEVSRYCFLVSAGFSVVLAASLLASAFGCTGAAGAAAGVVAFGSAFLASLPSPALASTLPSAGLVAGVVSLDAAGWAFGVSGALAAGAIGGGVAGLASRARAGGAAISAGAADGATVFP